MKSHCWHESRFRTARTMGSETLLRPRRVRVHRSISPGSTHSWTHPKGARQRNSRIGDPARASRARQTAGKDISRGRTQDGPRCAWAIRQAAKTVFGWLFFLGNPSSPHFLSIRRSSSGANGRRPRALLPHGWHQSGSAWRVRLGAQNRPGGRATETGSPSIAPA
jgi:hypothetical protein